VEDAEKNRSQKKPQNCCVNNNAAILIIDIAITPFTMRSIQAEILDMTPFDSLLFVNPFIPAKYTLNTTYFLPSQKYIFFINIFHFFDERAK
jgi:hypothetical protein